LGKKKSLPTALEFELNSPLRVSGPVSPEKFGIVQENAEG